MSFWSSRFSSWLQQSRQVGTDSLTLLAHLMKAPSMTRTILINQARQANTVALSYLRVEREIGLVQYHGFMGYLRQHPRSWRSSSSNRSASFGTTSATSNSTTTTTSPTQQQQHPPTKARVAFMITSSQRSSLQQELGYSEQQIKQLKPLEASLILEHQLSPPDSVGRLAPLVAAYHASLIPSESPEPIGKTKEETGVEGVPGRGYDRLSQSSVEQEEAPPLQLAASAQPVTKETPPPILPRVGAAAAVTSDNTIPKGSPAPIRASLLKKQWYELLEETEAGAMQVIGLYSKLDEANLVLETKEDLAKKYLPRIPKYVVRRTER
jgi:hypothetical protein